MTNKCFALTLNDPSVEVCPGCREEVCFALWISPFLKYKLAHLAPHWEEVLQLKICLFISLT